MRLSASHSSSSGDAMETTICWTCKNAVPDRDGEVGCAWSRSFVPVEGWEATPTKIVLIYNDEHAEHRRGPRTDDSYIVHSCPEYERG